MHALAGLGFFSFLSNMDGVFMILERYRDADCIIFTHTNIVVVCFLGALQPAHLVALAPVVEQLKQRSAPRNFGVLVAVHPKAPVPTSAMRRPLLKLYAEHAPSIYGVATLLLGDELRLSTVRLLFRSFSLMANIPYPTRVFSQLAVATAWLVPLCGGALSSDIRKEIGACVQKCLGIEL